MQKHLFVELIGGIGDLLLALPAIQALGRAHPEAELTVLTLAPGGSLLEHDPHISQIAYAHNNTPTEKMNIRNSVQAFLQEHHFDLIVSDTAFDGIDQLILQSGAERCVTNLWRKPPANQRISERFLHILKDEGIIRAEDMQPGRVYLTAAERMQARKKLGRFSRPLVLLFADSGLPIKKWPLERFVEVGQGLQRQYEAQIVVLTGADPREAQTIANRIGGNARACPKVSLREVAAIISHADLFISGDTGLAHLAAALEVPTIMLFGPSWYARYGQAAPHLNLQAYPDCPERVVRDVTLQPCWYAESCPLGKWKTCMEAIRSDDVLLAAASFLKEWIDRFQLLEHG